MLKLKNFLNENKVAIIIFSILLFIVMYSCFKYIRNDIKVREGREERITYCKSDEVKESEKLSCEQYIEAITNEEIKTEFYSMFGDILVFDIHYLNFIAFLVVIIPSLYCVSNYLYNRVITNCLTRQSYKSFIKDFIRKAYKYYFILPVIMGVLILICLFYSEIDPAYSLSNNYSIWQTNLIFKPVLFVFLYLINITIYSLSYVNISLIVLRKQQNIIKAIILSVLVFVGIEVFLEIVVNGLIFGLVFKSEVGNIFNIMNLLIFNINYGASKLLTFTISFFLLTFILVLILYKNKEKLIIDCEKNN